MNIGKICLLFAVLSVPLSTYAQEGGCSLGSVYTINTDLTVQEEICFIRGFMQDHIKVASYSERIVSDREILYSVPLGNEITYKVNVHAYYNKITITSRPISVHIEIPLEDNVTTIEDILNGYEAFFAEYLIDWMRKALIKYMPK